MPVVGLKPTKLLSLASCVELKPTGVLTTPGRCDNRSYGREAPHADGNIRMLSESALVTVLYRLAMELFGSVNSDFHRCIGVVSLRSFPARFREQYYRGIT